MTRRKQENIIPVRWTNQEDTTATQNISPRSRKNENSIGRKISEWKKFWRERKKNCK